MAKLLINNGTVVTLGEKTRVLPNHSILVEGDTIKAIAPDIRENADTVVNAKGKVVLPGFINAHTHFYSTFARGLGKAKPSRNFNEVLENLWWRLDKKLTLEDSYVSAAIACIDAIRHGTTTLIDHHASPFAITGSLGRIADAVRETGVRACLCYELSDRDGEERAEEGIRENLEFLKACRKTPSDRLAGLFGMHASFTISDKTMERAVEGAKEYASGFHIHAAEAASDQDHCEKTHGMRVVERLKKLGVLGCQTICAHGVHLTDREIDLLAETDTALVHNPQSNMNNAVGVADILKMIGKGVLVGLGTDAMTENMLEEVRSALWVLHLSRKEPNAGFMEVLTALLTNNAQIARRIWPFGIGEIREGFKADLILMDYDPPTEFSENTFLGHLLFGMSQSTVDTTICGGKVLMQGKKLVGIDEARISARARELSAALWQRF